MVALRTWKTAAVVAALAAVCACGSSVPEESSAPAKTTARSKRSDPAFATRQTRAPGKTAPAAAKAFKGAILKGPEAVTDAAAGATIQGRLERGDAQMPEDKSYVDYHGYSGRRGERITITLESSDFDAFLMLAIGPSSALRFIGNDDDSGGGTNARLEVTLPEDGRYTILANSYDSGQTGSYVLRIAKGTAIPSIERNSTVTGRLEQTDTTLDDGTFYDAWLFQGRGGERLTATLTSTDFDAFLLVSAGSPGALETIAEDDDSAGGTNARLVITIPEDGVYSVVANSFERATGAYTLRVESAEPVDVSRLYPGGGDPNGRYALLVGINDYPGTESDLPSSVADVRLIRDTLINKFGYSPANIVMLLDEDGNRDHIINAFTRHLGQAGPRGTAFFYYSGHGFQLDNNTGIRPPDDPEPSDGKDEALYIWGYGEQSTMLLDDELGALIDRLPTERTLVILDSCSSGSGTRGQAIPKLVTIDPKDINNVAGHLFWPSRFEGEYKSAAPVESTTAGLLDGSVRRRPHVLLAGSQDVDFSYAATGWPDRGGVASVFTYFLVGALESVTPTTTFRDLLNTVAGRTTAYTRDRKFDPLQRPQIGGDLANMRVAAFFSAAQ